MPDRCAHLPLDAPADRLRLKKIMDHWANKNKDKLFPGPYIKVPERKISQCVLNMDSRYYPLSLLHKSNEIVRDDPSLSHKDSIFSEGPAVDPIHKELYQRKLLRPTVFFLGPLAGIRSVETELPLVLRGIPSNDKSKQKELKERCNKVDTSMREDMATTTALPIMR
jgi:hypothetical protein